MIDHRQTAECLLDAAHEMNADEASKVGTVALGHAVLAFVDMLAEAEARHARDDDAAERAEVWEHLQDELGLQQQVDELQQRLAETQRDLGREEHRADRLRAELDLARRHESLLRYVVAEKGTIRIPSATLARKVGPLVVSRTRDDGAVTVSLGAVEPEQPKASS